MRDKELISLLRNNPNINLLAQFTTPWHAAGVNASLQWIRKTYNTDIKGLFLISQHSGKYLISESDLIFKSSEDTIILDKPYKKSFYKKIYTILMPLKLLIKNNNEKKLFFVLNTAFPNFDYVYLLRKARRIDKVIYVIIDEGIGSYLLKDVRFWAHFKTPDNLNAVSKMFCSRIIYILSCIRSFMKNSKIIKLVEEGGYVENFILKKNENDSLVINDKIIPYYISTFKRQIVSKYDSAFNIYAGSILINTSPYVEDGININDEDINIMQKLIPIINKHVNRIILKPHPRENSYGRYKVLNCIVDERKGLSQEVIISKSELKPLAVVGFCSSTLVSLRALFDIPAISLAYFLLDISNNSKLIIDIQEFITKFSDIVMFPKNISELEDCISKCKNVNSADDGNYDE